MVIKRDSCYNYYGEDLAIINRIFCAVCAAGFGKGSLHVSAFAALLDCFKWKNHAGNSADGRGALGGALLGFRQAVRLVFPPGAADAGAFTAPGALFLFAAVEYFAVESAGHPGGAAGRGSTLPRPSSPCARPSRAGLTRFILANSITLTPGTITVRIDDEHMVVHALNEKASRELSHSPFIRELEKWEGQSDTD